MEYEERAKKIRKIIAKAWMDKKCGASCPAGLRLVPHGLGKATDLQNRSDS
jgi:hypothetical protein